MAGGVSLFKGAANAVVAVQETWLEMSFGIREQQNQAYARTVGFYRETSETIKTLAGFAQQVADDSVAYIVHAEHGQLEEVNEISARYQAVTEYTVELVQELADEYFYETDFRKGEIFGKAMFAAVTMVAPYVKAGQAAQAGKLAFLTSLRNAPFFQNNTPALAALDRAIARLQGVGLICFVAGTPVHTKEGFKGIEQVKPGDWVLARDAFTGQQGYKPVVRTFVTHPEQMYHLRYRVRQGGDGGERSAAGDSESGEDDDPAHELVTTGSHPFFVPSLGQFVAAAELEVGSDLRLADGRRAEITSIELEHAPEGELFTTYNFEVADYHTYFVGEPGVWVHNAALGSRTCSRFDSHYKQARRAGKNEWEAFEEVEAANKTAIGADVADLAGEAVARMLKLDANGNLRYPVDAFPKVTELNEMLVGRKGWGTRTSRRGKQYSGVLTEVHHTIRKDAVRELLKPPSRLKNVSGIDDQPGLPIGGDDHTGIRGLHSYIDPELDALPSFRDPDEVRDALMRGYHNAGRTDLEKLTEEWFNLHRQ